MRRDDLCDILDKIPPHDVPKTVLILRFATSITLDSIIRKEDEYLVVRGREAGTNDDARAFFVPFDEVLCVKLDRVVKLSEMKRMYGEKAEDEADNNAPKATGEAGKTDPTVTPAPASPMDPAAIAKQNLLARIRAARTGTKLPG